MRAFSIPLKVRILRLDPILALSVIAVSFLSILTLISGNDVFSTSKLIIQIFAVVIGCGFMFIFSFYDYEEAAKKFWIPLIIFSFFLLLFTSVFGSSEGTNSAWIRFGPIGIQPSEFVKLAFIISFGRHLDMVKENINHIKSLIGLLLHIGTIIGAVLITGDLGSALVFLVIAAVMMFCAGLSLWYFAGAGLAGVIGFPFLWSQLAEYQKQRILVGFNPEMDPYDKGHQALLSREAISSGGFFGNGFNGGSVYKSLYAANTDFIFSTMLEKFGFIAGLILFVLLTIIVIRLIKIALTSKKTMGAYMCAGVTALIIAQTAENIGMCLAMLPVVGITLPFMSYGGSSVLSLYMIMGLVQSIHTNSNKYNFDRDSSL
ncbi:MAG: FtsW/RodA/SpoVE family cell cycle protein [Clostridia bacterium]|nr:FtsW/RodA/SpoVE family cell cycle protein [Clostridia bacterium]